MRRFPLEMLISVAMILAITGLYLFVARDALPPPGGLIGHGLGIIGFLLMLSTEVMYSLRKRLHGFTYGRMSTWLQAHIVTGLVGPYLVLLHSAGKFNGLAGVAMVLTAIMVLSGFVGRYLYTATPRTIEGSAVGAEELEACLARTDEQLRTLGVEVEEMVRLVEEAGVLPRNWQVVWGRSLSRWRLRRCLRRLIQTLCQQDNPYAAQLQALLEERYQLLVQIRALVMTRRLLALWHLFHIPLGAVLFTLAFLHIVAALYYSTLLK
ncbi:MAG: hypothetical protein ACK4RK_05975 [Gemmataceae bacterium]